MKKQVIKSTKLFELFSDKKIDYEITFGTEISSVFDLSYFLIDFQSVANGLSELIASSEIKDAPYEIANSIDDENRYKLLEQDAGRHEVNNVVEQGSISLNFEEKDIVPLKQTKKNTYKQTTNRLFNKKYRKNWQLKGFSKGSLVLQLTSAIVEFLVIEFLKRLVEKKTGNNNIINTTITNSIIIINGNDINSLPPNSHISNSLIISNVRNEYSVDIKNYTDNIVNAAAPNENVEESVVRFLDVLKREGIIESRVSYDSRGVKKLVKDYDRMVGSFFDVRV